MKPPAARTSPSKGKFRRPQIVGARTSGDDAVSLRDIDCVELQARRPNVGHGAVGAALVSGQHRAYRPSVCIWEGVGLLAASSRSATRSSAAASGVMLRASARPSTVLVVSRIRPTARNARAWS